MDPEKLEDLISGYLEDALSPEEAETLFRELRENPEAQRSLLLTSEIDAALRDFELSQAPAGAVNRPGTARFRGSTAFRAALRERGVARGTSWKTAVAAAGLVAAGTLLLAMLVSQSDPSEVNRAARRTKAAPLPPPIPEDRAQPQDPPTRAPREATEARLAEVRRALEEEEERRRRAEETLQEDLRRKSEEELGRLAREFRQLQERLANREPPEPAKPAAPSPPSTVVPVAQLELVQGQVFVVGKGEKNSAKEGELLLPGQGLETGDAGRVVILYADKSRVELAPGTLIRELGDRAGKWVDLVQGTLRSEIQKQPPGRAMVISTPHGEATVLGTTLRIAVDARSTLLEVTEGRVRLKRLSDGKATEVTSGHTALLATGVEFAARPTPIDEIFLAPQQGTRVGNEWRLTVDNKASTGWALEVPLDLPRSQTVPQTPLAKIPSYVSFKFRADANKEYFVWVRGLALPTPRDPALHDAVILEVPRCRVTQPGFQSSGGPQSAEYNGFMDRQGYGWLGGWGASDASGPVSMRFLRSGEQTLRLYAWEAPIRIDAIWLSTTQKTRPADDHRGPDSGKK